MRYKKFSKSKPMFGLSRPVDERFWEKVEKADNCWVWRGTLLPTGYGAMRILDRMILAHRLSYILLHGSIPPGLQIDHLCRNRACVRPDHLEAVTQAENLMRIPRPGRGTTRRSELCVRGHILPPLVPGKYLNCPECDKIRHREWYQRKKAKKNATQSK